MKLTKQRCFDTEEISPIFKSCFSSSVMQISAFFDDQSTHLVFIFDLNYPTLFGRLEIKTGVQKQNWNGQ